MKILIVEDEAKTVAYLTRGLSEEGWIADHATTGPLGLRLAQEGAYDAIVLDVGLPGLDGFGVLDVLRETHSTPVVMLTARDAFDDRIRGLKAGADDYLVKPFSFVELLARLRLAVKRSQPDLPEVFRLADLTIDFIGRRVARGGRRLQLTAREFILLEVLARRQAQIVSKTAIADLVWGVSYETNTNVVEVAIARLRAKLDLPGEARLIHTIRGMGYVLESRAPDGAAPGR